MAVTGRDNRIVMRWVNVLAAQSTDLEAPPTTFGPFPSSDQARAFAYDHNFHAYTATVVYPPEDGDHLRIARGGA